MRDWFAGLVGETYAGPAMWVFAIVIIALLLLIFYRFARRYGSGTFVAGGKNRKARLAVMDATAIDNHRRLVLVRRDDVEHLLLIGGQTDIVVEQHIRPASRPARPTVAPQPDVEEPPVPYPSPLAASPAAPSSARAESVAPLPPRREPEAPPRAPEPARPVAPPATPANGMAANLAPPPAPAAPASVSRTVPPAPQTTAGPATGTATVSGSAYPLTRQHYSLGTPSDRPASASQAAFPRPPASQGAPRESTVPVRDQAPVPSVAPPIAAVSGATPVVAAASQHSSDEREFDDALLEAFEITLDESGTPEVLPEAKDDDDALQDEMMKLLDDLSGERR